MSATIRYHVTAAGWSAVGRVPRLWRRRDGFIVTALGALALEEAREQNVAPQQRCCFCGSEFEPDEPVVDAGAGRTLHEHCAREYSQFLTPPHNPQR